MPDVTSRLIFLDRHVGFDITLNSDDPNDAFMLDHLNRGICYEPEVVQVMTKVVREGDHCLDIGANVGYFTLLLSSLVGETGSVLAFEPGSNNIPRLQMNLRANNVRNVNAFEQAAWCRNERIKFYLNADSAGSNAVWDPGKFYSNIQSRQRPEFYEVDAVAVDTYVDRSIRLIKIDTEGAEQRILEGLERTLSKQPPPFVVVELNPFGSNELGCSNETMRAYMRRFGYDIFLIYEDGRLPALVPPNTEITHLKGVYVMNAMFSTVEDVGKAWPKAPYS